MQQSKVIRHNDKFIRTGNSIVNSQINGMNRNRQGTYKSRKYGDITDSLSEFQSELQSLVTKKASFNNQTRLRKQRSAQRQLYPYEKSKDNDLNELKRQMIAIKQSVDSQNDLSKMEKKLQTMLKQLMQTNRKRQTQLNMSKVVQYQTPIPQYQTPQFMYPPIPHPYPPYYPQLYSKRNKTMSYYNENQSSDSQEQQQYRHKKKRDINTDKKPRKKLMNTNQNKNTIYSRQKQKPDIRKRLRRAFYTVAFVMFLRSQAQKFSKVRKSNLRKYWLQKFDSQVNNIKNWLLEACKYSLAIILQKKHLNFMFIDEPRKPVKHEKQKLLLQLTQISLKQLVKNCTAHQISLFAQTLQTLCKRSSFIMNRFWTAFEMQLICISQYYGFMRIDSYGEKALITILVFIKMLIFNMLLQPYKFDPNNFRKGQQPLLNNMMIYASIWYELAKSYINQCMKNRSKKQIYEYGNWLKTKKEFIIQCSQPLIYGNVYPDDDQFISGLIPSEEIAQLTANNTQIWENCQEHLRMIVERLHEHMFLKGSLVTKNLKYKLYN